MSVALKVSSALRGRLKNPKLLEPFSTPGAKERFAVNDPSGALGLSEPIALVPDVSDVEEAISRASEAFQTFSRTTATQRSRLLKALAEAQRKNSDDLATILSCESGKPLREAKGEIEYGASYLEWFSEEAKRAYGTEIPATFPNRRNFVTREPVGVCSFVTPFNFGNAMLARKAAAALAAGCTIVARPSEDVPLSAIAFSNLIQTLYPEGVFNIVPSSRDNADHVGKAFSTDERIAKLSFTGSTAVGKKLLAQCATTVKRTSMELGGNACFIVFDCADVNAAVDGLMASKFRNAGQTCVCSNRIFVQKTVYPLFVQRLSEKIKSLRVGRALDDKAEMGSLIHDRAASRVENLVKDTLASNSAQLILGGKRETTFNRNFFQPTLLVDVKDDAAVFRNEIFGPVAAVASFDSEEEAIARANGTRSGLASYFYATNANRIMRVSRALESGMIGVNTGIISTEVAPFGGVKESGFGREGSKYGLDDYTHLKYVAWQY